MTMKKVQVLGAVAELNGIEWSSQNKDVAAILNNTRDLAPAYSFEQNVEEAELARIKALFEAAEVK